MPKSGGNLNAKGYKRLIWGNENVLKLDWGAGYNGVYICQNSPNFTLEI